MTPLLLIAVYCGVIAVFSVAGGRLSSLLRMTHLRTQLLMSGVGGLMLGIAMLHLLPHATETLGSPSRAGLGALAGLAAMFLLIRLFHTHDHNVPVVDDDDSCCEHGEAANPETAAHHSRHQLDGHLFRAAAAHAGRRSCARSERGCRIRAWRVARTGRPGDLSGRCAP